MCNFIDACDFNNNGEYHPAMSSPVPHGCPFPHAVTRLYYERGTFLFHQGDGVRGGYHLTAGLVALERVDEDGRLVILKVLRPGTLFPCADLFAQSPHGSTARALTDAQACFIPLERLMAAMADADNRALLLRVSAAEARDSENAIFRLCAGDLADQVMAMLAAVIEDRHLDGRAVHGILPLCWRELAAMVGTSPEVMSRTVRKLERCGRLNVKGRAVTLHPRTQQRRRLIRH